MTCVCSVFLPPLSKLEIAPADPEETQRITRGDPRITQRITQRRPCILRTGDPEETKRRPRGDPENMSENNPEETHAFCARETQRRP